MNKKRVPILTITTIVVSGLLLTGCHRHRSFDPENFGKKLEQHVEHVLNSIDATDEQKAKIHSITEAIQQDFAAMYRNKSFNYRDALEWRRHLIVNYRHLPLPPVPQGIVSDEISHEMGNVYSTRRTRILFYSHSTIQNKRFPLF